MDYNLVEIEENGVLKTVEVDLCLILPEETDVSNIKPMVEWTLRFQDLNTSFKCEKSHWDQAKHCFWWWDKKEKQPINASGVLYTDYVGIFKKRLTSNVEKYSFKLDCYH